MSDSKIEQLINKNQKLSLLLGYATGLLKIPDASRMDDEYFNKIEWLFKAIENIVYLDKKLPPMP